MNIHTFKDAATSKRSAVANDLDEDDDEQDVAEFKREIEGEEEEEDGQTKA